jgi:hypothetical protein
MTFAIHGRPGHLVLAVTRLRLLEAYQNFRYPFAALDGTRALSFRSHHLSNAAEPIRGLRLTLNETIAPIQKINIILDRWLSGSRWKASLNFSRAAVSLPRNI